MGGIILTKIAGVLAEQGLRVLAGKLLSNPKRHLPKVKEKISGDKDISDDDLLKKIVDQGQFQDLMDLEYEMKREEEVSKRSAADNHAESWFTAHVRPLSLCVIGIFYLIYTLICTFVLENPIKIETAVSFGNNLFMMLTTMFGFYFGGRTLEKRKRS